jgi:tetratricopeptide (TPR) repeat protein
VLPWLTAGVVALATLAIYGSILGAPFLLDDIGSIVDNPTLHSLASALVPRADIPLSGRPLANLSFALNYAVGGDAPWGYRLVNALLHCLNVGLVYGLLRRCLCSQQLPVWLRANGPGLSAAVSLLWAVHPLQTEAIAYVTQRTELLASLFILLTLLASLRALGESNPRRWQLMAAVACLLGGACKESVISAPFCVLALDWALFSPSLAAALRRHWRLYLGLVLALLPMLLAQLSLPREQTAGFGVGVSPWQWLFVQSRAIGWYLRLSVWPTPLSVSYNWPLDRAVGRYWPCALLLGGLLGLTLMAAREARWASLPGWLFFAMLAPSSSFVPIISEVAAERRMYLALLPVLILLATGFLYFARRRRRLGWPVCAVLVLVLGARAQQRAHDYRLPEALFRAALETAPDNPQALWGLALALESSQPTAAIDLYERMAEGDYPYLGPASWGTRGLVAEARLYERLGDRPRATAALARALAHDPDSTVGRLQAAALLTRERRDREALDVLQGLLAQPFLLERVHRELGQLYLRRGELAPARAHLSAALERDPRDPVARGLLQQLPAVGP